MKYVLYPFYLITLYNAHRVLYNLYFYIMQFVL